MVWREINKLKSEKSAGPDGWPIQVNNAHNRFPYHCPFYLTNPFNLVIFLATGKLYILLQYTRKVCVMLLVTTDQ